MAYNGPPFIMNEQNKQTNQLLQGINLKITLQPDKRQTKEKNTNNKKNPTRSQDL